MLSDGTRRHTGFLIKSQLLSIVMQMVSRKNECEADHYAAGAIDDPISPVDALETGSLQLTDLAPRIQRLRQRQEQLNTARRELEHLLSDKKVELADMNTVTGYVADLRNLLSESPLAERKSFIKSFVKEVKVIGTEVLLTYTVPMPPKGISREVIGVLPIDTLWWSWGDSNPLPFDCRCGMIVHRKGVRYGRDK